MSVNDWVNGALCVAIGVGLVALALYRLTH